jgi:hypothetical protein
MLFIIREESGLCQKIYDISIGQVLSWNEEYNCGHKSIWGESKRIAWLFRGVEHKFDGYVKNYSW